MIITRTPFRISFFGGGTDYPVYYREHGGSVISTSINKYCYVTCRELPPFFDHRFLIRYGKREATQTVEEIEHPSVRECLKYMGVQHGIEMVHTGDIPARSGVGSSSAFTVGLLQALYAMRGQLVTKRKLAMDAIHVEQNLIGEAVGSQDQIATAFGGFNAIEFFGNDSIRVQPLTLSREKFEYLEQSLLFVFTGLSRNASSIAQEQIKETSTKLQTLHRMRQMVSEALAILNGPDHAMDDFGRLLHESWCLKRSLTGKITNAQIDEIYKQALRSGALGGKLCGAGGGGFLLLYAPAHAAAQLRKTLSDFVIVPFRFEQLGSQIVYYATDDSSGVSGVANSAVWDGSKAA